MDFTALQGVLLVTSLASALIYLVRFLHASPTTARSVFKTVPVAALAVATLAFDGPILLALALALSALGDLALSRDGDNPFRLGLGAFLLAHLAYVALFLGPVTLLALWQVTAMILIVLVAGAALSILWSGLGAMRIPVIAYVIVIAAMAAAAVLRGGPAPLLAGAALFMLSDLVLGAEAFRLPATTRRWSAPVIWITYYGAQVMIAAAFLCPHFAA